MLQTFSIKSVSWDNDMSEFIHSALSNVHPDEIEKNREIKRWLDKLLNRDITTIGNEFIIY